MRARNKTCSYPRDHHVAVPAISLPTQSGDTGATLKSPAAGSVVDGRDGEPPEQDKSTRREVWQSYSVGSLSFAIPSGSKLGSNEDIRLDNGDDDVPSQQPTGPNRSAYGKGSRQSNLPGLRTSSRKSPYMDTYPINGLIVKKRYYPTTHWMFSLTLTPFAIDWLDDQMRSQERIWQDLMTCKFLVRTIKARRVLLWEQGQYGKQLPTKTLADTLFEAYLRTSESIYRIIHIPTSKRIFTAMYEDLNLISPAHIVQLQLCLAIGACFYDDEFSLRPQALQWIREAEHWLESPGKLRLTVRDIQTMCLLHLARQTAQSQRETQVWASSGALVRAAMSVGLHRDPARLPSMPFLEVEMRRRVWMTIMELVLDSSVDAAGPPMFSLDDFDCSLPLNLNDAELDAINGDVTPHDPAEYTDTSVQIALGRTFSTRLSIAKYANGIKTENSEEETLRLSSKLMDEYRSLAKTLHSLRPSATMPQQRYCDLILSRYIFTLHLPFVPRALKDPTQFSFSRAICVDTALRLVSSSLPSSSSLHDPMVAAMQSVHSPGNHSLDFSRLLMCGSGPFRSVPWQAIMIIAAELAATIRQAHETSPWTSLMPFNQAQTGNRMRCAELLALLREAKKLTRNRVRAGHLDVKDVVYIAVILAGIEAAMDGVPAEPAMDEQGKEILAEAVGIFAEMAGTGTSVWDNPPDLDDEDFGGASEFWSIGFSGMEWDTFT
ncbi:hypothetical protein M426DRAFT_322703 [Hypoxylon sp. CI-4A]|nr:hypothetical protein M426DRAFT_322703 [Hypoxylon sp. CI-4A]